MSPSARRSLNGLTDTLVRQRGRSAVLREAIAAYLARKDADEIGERYRTGYGAAPPGDELQAWPGKGVWPGR